MSLLIELYRFVEGDTVHTVTSSDQPYEHNGEIYSVATVSRGKTESRAGMARSSLDISFAANDPLAARWAHDRVESPVTLSIFEVDENDEVGIVWKGRFTGVKPTTTNVQLVFESIYTSLKRVGLRAIYQRYCRHMHYGTACGVNRDDYVVTAQIESVSNSDVIVEDAANYPDGYFSSGMIVGDDGIMRYILSHTGVKLTLLQPSLSLLKLVNIAGRTSCTLYPGCAKNRAACKDKFNNLDNYGGFDWIPIRNPYNGSSII